MYSEPRDLARTDLVRALARHWAIDADRLEYVPVGFGSHHWEAVGPDGARWFVSVDDLRAGHHGGRAPEQVFAALDHAFRAAAALRDHAGLEFVQAPTRGGGAVLHRIDARYAIRVEPFLDGEAGESGDYEHAADRRRVGRLVGRLHVASPRISAELPGREDFTLPGRGELEAAIGLLDTPWAGGPFAEPARRLLQEHAGRLRERLRTYDQRAAAVLDDQGTWVVTHGEPHSANVLRTPDGGLRLLDWDTLLIGPRERDLWMVLDDDLTGWEQYRDVAGDVDLNTQTLALYRERWALAEICIYVGEFRRPHEETEDTRVCWRELAAYLA
jgi:spectinomycin phosphotransferase